MSAEIYFQPCGVSKYSARGSIDQQSKFVGMRVYDVFASVHIKLTSEWADPLCGHACRSFDVHTQAVGDNSDAARCIVLPHRHHAASHRLLLALLLVSSWKLLRL